MIGRLKYWVCMLFYVSTNHNWQIITFEWKLQLSYNTVDATFCKQMCYFSGFVVSFSECGQSRCSITLMDTRTFLVIHEDGLSFKWPRASAPNRQATCPVIPWSQTSTHLLSCPSCLDDIFVQYKVAFSNLKICCLVKLASSVICISEFTGCSFSHVILAPSSCMGMFQRWLIPSTLYASFCFWPLFWNFLLHLIFHRTEPHEALSQDDVGLILSPQQWNFLHIATKSVSLHEVLLFEWLF